MDYAFDPRTYAIWSFYSLQYYPLMSCSTCTSRRRFVPIIWSNQFFAPATGTTSRQEELKEKTYCTCPSWQIRLESPPFRRSMLREGLIEILVLSQSAGTLGWALPGDFGRHSAKTQPVIHLLPLMATLGADMIDSHGVRRKDTTKGPALRILSLGELIEEGAITQLCSWNDRWRRRSRLLNAYHPTRTHASNLCRDGRTSTET